MTIEGITYNCAEQFIMRAKAILFRDKSAATAILMATDPVAIKALGDRIRRQKDTIWKGKCFDIALTGAMAKFEQNSDLAEFLLSTNHRTLVEGSPHDPWWGAGVHIFNQNIATMETFPGKNNMGRILEKVRDSLRAALPVAQKPPTSPRPSGTPMETASINP
jgi:hypothetical protein